MNKDELSENKKCKKIYFLGAGIILLLIGICMMTPLIIDYSRWHHPLIEFVAFISPTLGIYFILIFAVLYD